MLAENNDRFLLCGMLYILGTKEKKDELLKDERYVCIKSQSQVAQQLPTNTASTAASVQSQLQGTNAGDVQ